MSSLGRGTFLGGLAIAGFLVLLFGAFGFSTRHRTGKRQLSFHTLGTLPRLYRSHGNLPNLM
jgi:hypothetical protein